jgi:phage terminase large subunit-like protein
MDLTTAEKRELVALIEEKERRRQRNKLAEYSPYPKQAEFHALGVAIRERLLCAGNQLGKTLSAGFEVAMHLTGRYPSWWAGRVWDRPIVAWVASETMEVSRDAAQRILLGREMNRGMGAIPGDCLLEVSPYPNVKGAASQAKVRHVSGGTSLVIFKSYDQGRRKFQGDTIDLFWPDEEPPQEIYTEGLTRTNATGGMVLMTFTPLLGMSDVVRRFMLEESPDRRTVNMTIDDAEHYTPEERARIVASYPAHEREARAKGIPTLGSGRVFPVTEESITVEPFAIPAEWAQLGGMDFGYDHPFGAVKVAWDREADVLYVTAAYRKKEATPVIHAAALRPWGDWLPWSWPHDGLQHDKGSGEQLAAQYRSQALNLLSERATFEDGTNGVEAGVTEMLDRMLTGRLKVFSNLTEWFEEFRLYHRENGRIVKLHDDLLSATRYALMMRRHASTGRPAAIDLDNYAVDYA